MAVPLQKYRDTEKRSSADLTTR